MCRQQKLYTKHGKLKKSALADYARNLLPFNDMTASGCIVARILRLAWAPASGYAAFERVDNPCTAFLDASEHITLYRASNHQRCLEPSQASQMGRT